MPETRSIDTPADRTQILVGLARDGDSCALEELYRAVSPAVYSWIWFRTPQGLRGRLDPDELAQETWMRALQKLEVFDASLRPFRGWILKVARYVLIEASRSLVSGAPWDRSAAGSTFFARQPDPHTGVLTGVVRCDALQYFLEHVGGMTDDERELVVLRGLEGRPLDEVGRRFGVSADTIGKRWRRLRERLVRSGAPDILL